MAEAGVRSRRNPAGLLEPGGLVRERRMLAGIRDRAESVLPAAELLPA